MRKEREEWCLKIELFSCFVIAYQEKGAIWV